MYEVKLINVERSANPQVKLDTADCEGSASV